jgi:hypothetical protein
MVGALITCLAKSVALKLARNLIKFVRPEKLGVDMFG